MLEDICVYLEIPTTTTECYDIAQRFTIEKNVLKQASHSEWINIDVTMLTKEHISPNFGKPPSSTATSILPIKRKFHQTRAAENKPIYN